VVLDGGDAVAKRGILLLAAAATLVTPLAVAAGSPTPGWAATGPADLALNRPATGSTPCARSEGPAKAVNGSVSGGRSDKFCTAATNGFLQVDLGAPTTIGSFVVRHAAAGGEPPALNTRDFDLAVSPDGANFTTVARVRGNTAPVTTNPVTASGRYIRLTVLRPTQNSDPAARIYELEVYGPATPPPPPTGAMAAAPYMFHWAAPPDAPAVMAATGVKWFSMAFMLSGGGCTPAWDGQRPLHGDVDEAIITGIRAAGGDVIVSFGGWSGTKLGPNCADPPSLAAAYQQVIDAYRLKAVDFDVENSDEFGNSAVRQRILGAIRILEQNNPDLTAILTFGTSPGGPGSLIIDEAHSIGANVDVFTIMPFDFGGSDMFADTVSAAEGLRSQLMQTFGWSADTAYRHMGISSMNGITDAGETVTPSTFTQIRDWAAARHLARLSFWAVNRDHACPPQVPAGDTCSGINQNDWDFTRINAGY
jgi:F5/8 type C domain